MNDYAFDAYMLACVHVEADSEEEARHALAGLQGEDVLHLPTGVSITEISYRKVMELVYADDADGNDLAVGVLPTDGCLPELEEDEE